MHSDFKALPLGRSILVTVGGVFTAAITIAGLEYLSIHLHRTDTSLVKVTPRNESVIASLDAKSLAAVGNPLPPADMVPQLPTRSAAASALTPAELAMAKRAWQYFERNWQTSTGLVNSANDFPSVTIWDQAAAMAALVSAKELELVPDSEFQTKMSQMLATLAKLPLYKGELPNKVYNSQTLLPVGYGTVTTRKEIGWSAIDLGRMAIWLKIVGGKYPQLKTQTETVWKSWDVTRLVKDGEMFGTAVVDGKEQYNQEGRLGYESYAAYGLKLWGLSAPKALDTKANTAFVGIYGQGVPYDRRDAKNSGANNYVLSEPYILDGIETGFQALPQAYADRVLAAQEARYKTTKQLTAVTEDNLDRAPYFVYNSLFVNGKAWANITDKGDDYHQLRFLSAKAAIGWHVLYDTPYTNKLSDFVMDKLQAEGGWYNGFYEVLRQPNKAQTANNNGVILQSLLYKKVGQPLTIWAGVTPTAIPSNSSSSK
jgi:hypothetical protein